MNNIKISIEDIFSYNPKPPFSVKLDLFSPDNNDISTLFNKIKDIYIKGLIVQINGSLNSGNNELQIEKVKDIHIDIMEKHMLSFGIKTNFIKMTRNDKDALFRYLLYDLEKGVPDLNLHVTIDWRMQHIMKIDFNVPKDKQENIVKNVNKITTNHNVANIFLKIKKAEKLREHGIIIKKKRPTG